MQSGRFGDVLSATSTSAQAVAAFDGWTDNYSDEHRHSGIGLHTPRRSTPALRPRSARCALPSVSRLSEAGLDSETLSLRASMEFFSREFDQSGA